MVHGVETVRLSFTVFEIQPAVCRKSPILTHPTCILRPAGVYPGGISRIFLASESQTPWAIRRCCLLDPRFIRFGRTPIRDRQTNRQTDRQTNRHRLRPISYTALAQRRAVKTKKRKTEKIKSKKRVCSEVRVNSPGESTYRKFGLNFSGDASEPQKAYLDFRKGRSCRYGDSKYSAGGCSAVIHRVRSPVRRRCLHSRCFRHTGSRLGYTVHLTDNGTDQHHSLHRMYNTTQSSSTGPCTCSSCMSLRPL